MTKESVWLPPQCILDRLEQEQVLKLQQIVVDELQSSIDTIMKTLQKEQVLLVQAEECSKLMKIAARDATNSKATLLLGLNDRSEHMKNVLSKIRTRAMEGPQCLECSRKRATRRCTTCKSPYCASCFNTKHATGDYTGHSFLPIGLGSGLIGAGTSSQGTIYDQKPLQKSRVLQCTTCTTNHTINNTNSNSNIEGSSSAIRNAAFVVPTSQSYEKRSIKNINQQGEYLSEGACIA